MSSQPSVAPTSEPPWRSFARVSVLLAMAGGFLSGSLIGVARLFGWGAGNWQLQLAQAHGHIQIYGWAGLMVAGVAMHFLPRLVGARSIRSRRARAVLLLVAGGLVLRLLTQPLSGVTDGLPSRIFGWLTVAASLLEVSGAALFAGVIARVLLAGRRGAKADTLRPILPLLILAFGSFLLGFAGNLAGLTEAVSHGDSLVRSRANALLIWLGLIGFLVPVSVAMSARTFPLYARTGTAGRRGLGLTAGLLTLGLATESAGLAFGHDPAQAIGHLLLMIGLVTGTQAVGIFGPRRPRPRGQAGVWHDPLQLHAIAAYGWLILAALLIGWEGLSLAGLALPFRAIDAARHALGVGFVTLLIFGVGPHLLSGFARTRPRSVRLGWWTLALGNLSAITRVVPALLGGTSAWFDLGAALAGLPALAALGVFAINAGLVLGTPPRGADRSGVGD